MLYSFVFVCSGETTNTELEFFVYLTDLTLVQYSMLKNQQPLIFLRTTPGCGVRLRAALGMKDGDAEFFDPGSASE
jgi:hypothetical protein